MQDQVFIFSVLPELYHSILWSSLYQGLPYECMLYCWCIGFHRSFQRNLSRFLKQSIQFYRVRLHSGVMLPRDKVIPTNLVAPVMMSELILRARAEANVQRALRMVYLSRWAHPVWKKTHGMLAAHDVIYFQIRSFPAPRTSQWMMKRLWNVVNRFLL